MKKMEQHADEVERDLPEDESELTDPQIESNLEADEEAGDEEAFGALQAERDEFHDLLLRKQAEFENYKRRTEKEHTDVRASAQAEVIRQLLPIVDACEKGLASMRDHSKNDVSDSFIEGYELLLKQLQALLSKFSVSEVAGVGSQFDPNIHEAVLREVTDERPEGEVLEEYRKGYLIGERLLRPSQVKVSVEPE